MRFLVFSLYAPLASWGDIAVGEVRPSLNYPGRSAILGMLGAALGLERQDDEAHMMLARGFGVAVAVYREGLPLTDYHTVQVPGASEVKKRSIQLRADELAFAREELNTLESYRDYRQDAVSVACVWQKAATVRWSVDDLCAALRKPRFTLYLGRKSCPLAAPLAPEVVEEETIREVLQASQPRVQELAAQLGQASLSLQRVAWESGAPAGFTATFTVSRRDEVRSRRAWQFDDRAELVKLF